MKRSFIREILEHTTSKTISFAGGLPDPSLFPIKDISISAVKVLKTHNTLQYTTSSGVDALKEKIAKMYSDDGFATKASNILITSGSQQALDIISRYNTKSTMTIESPSYLGAMNVFDLNNIKQDSISLENDGVNIANFEKSFSKSKLAYLIPDFQNPSSRTYSNKKRKEIAQIIKKNNGVLIEDAPYSKLYFKKPFESISSLIPNNTYHLGSFSKTLAPSFRIGWIRADEKLLEPLIAYKEAMDLHTSGLGQYILNDYLSSKSKSKNHLKLLRKEYYKKMKIFSKQLKKILPEFKYDEPKGGMFIYGSLEGIDTSKLVKQCIKKDVVYVPGIEFYTNAQNKDEIRFNFTHSNKNDIIKGLRKISKIINKKR